MPSVYDRKTVVKRVTDYGPKPRSAKQALIQAHAFLTEEGQWMTGEFFKDGDPKEAYEKGVCSSWSACAMGALGLVTGEAPVVVVKETYEMSNFWGDPHQSVTHWFDVREDYNPVDTPLSSEAALELARVTNPDLFESYAYMDEGEEMIVEGGEHIESVINFNDSSGDKAGRTKVLDAFAETIRSLGGTPLVDHRAEFKRIERNAKRRAARAAAKRAAKKAAK